MGTDSGTFDGMDRALIAMFVILILIAVCLTLYSRPED